MDIEISGKELLKLMKVFTEKPENENLRELLEFCSECAQTLTIITLRLTAIENRLAKLESKTT